MPIGFPRGPGQARLVRPQSPLAKRNLGHSLRILTGRSLRGGFSNVLASLGRTLDRARVAVAVTISADGCRSSHPVERFLGSDSPNGLYSAAKYSAAKFDLLQTDLVRPRSIGRDDWAN
ncbi:MAG: hypothetical protein AAF664_16875 [Planctomycetota bacterium]